VAGDEIVILVVCTANQCRSPLTAGALRRHAEEAGLPVRVESAGITALPGWPATPPTVEAGRKLGIDLTAHSSTPLDPRAIRAADMVIGLERRHVQEIVLGDPGAFSKAFTLKELTRRGSAVGGRGAEQSVGEWLATLHAGRRPLDLLGVSSDDDIADPTGSNAVDHRTTAEELDTLSAQVMELLFGADGQSA
jgi:protein-tyrosine-phosphatase